jgi:putative ABC transport system substrate-binding protein
MRRREFIGLIGGAAAAWPIAAHAQLTRSVPKIGWLKIQGPLHTPQQLQAFREGMRALGMIEGRDFTLDERYAEGDEARLSILAGELISSGVSLIVATSQPSIAAA